MQTFQNTVNQTVWQFDPDVIVVDTDGVFSFKTSSGVPLKVPTTLVPFTIPTPTPAQLLADAQTTQSAIVKTSCANAITTTFSSSALGNAFNYDCGPLDQANISYVSVHGGSLWCQSGSNPWAFTAHTAAQGLQVQADMTAHIQAQQTIYAGLLSQINAATTVAAVQAIVWPT
jgi:hypothetical protein